MKPLASKDPRVVGRHRLVAVIGQGAMGRVMLGISPDGRLVAVKTIHQHLSRNTEFRERFRREVQASRRVTGAYTAAVMDADPDAPEPWLASVYVPGPSLTAAIDEFGPMPLGGLRVLAAGLAAALVEIHRAGIVHRDLKPANVLLSDDGPRVIDFGIARALAADLSLTSTGSVIGSPAYMSPEQASGQELTPASDVFSVGAMLFLAATGESPFLGASTPQTLYNVVHHRADVSKVPPALRSVVDACLDKNPARRPTPPQLLESVDGMAGRSAWPSGVRQWITRDRAEAQRWAALDGQPPSAPRSRRLSKRTAAAVGAVLVAAGGAAAVLWTSGGSGEADPLADRTLELSDEQLRVIDACALLGTDVVGRLGQPVRAELSTSGLCGTQFIESGGRRVRLTVGVGTSVSADKPLPETLAGRQVLDVTTQQRSCGRAVQLRTRPAVGVTALISDADGDSCGLADSALKAVVTRLVADPPSATLPSQSVVRLDPCAAVPPATVASQLGADVSPSPADTHTCSWTGATSTVTVHLAEEKRVDTDPNYPHVEVNGGRLGNFEVARRADADGTCTTDYLVRATFDQRGDQIVVSVRPTSPDGSEQACALSESVLLSAIDSLRRS